VQQIGIVYVPTDLDSQWTQRSKVAVEGRAQLSSRFPEPDPDDANGNQGQPPQPALGGQQPLDGQVSEHLSTGHVRRQVGRAGTRRCTDDEVPTPQTPPCFAGWRTDSKPSA